MSKLRLFTLTLMAFSIVALLLVSLMELGKSNSDTKPVITVRQVNVALPPPPPPPMQKQSSVQSPTAEFNIAVEGAGATLTLQKPDLNVAIAPPELPEMQLSHDQTALLDNLNFDWQAFGLADLDEMPRLLTNIKVSFPEKLKRRGIKIAEVELDVMIDEQGSVLLRRIVHNQHPELDSAIQKLVSRARFSVPKKDGMAVRAAFHWPVEFADS